MHSIPAIGQAPSRALVPAPLDRKLQARSTMLQSPLTSGFGSVAFAFAVFSQDSVVISFKAPKSVSLPTSKHFESSGPGVGLKGSHKRS